MALRRGITSHSQQMWSVLQAVVESGQQPTILRQLCSLPFQYFSNPKLVDILYPCLISCCYMSESNRAIIEQELSCDLLANYIEVGMPVSYKSLIVIAISLEVVSLCYHFHSIH